jgi:spore germination cell wall hydrolase CwlJ-like protein
VAPVSFAEYEVSILAICLWREARGELPLSDAITAIACVVRTRVVRRHMTWAAVVAEKFQFSSMTAPGDSQLVKWATTSNDKQFMECLRVASAVYSGEVLDVTGGATNYVNLQVAQPAWAASPKMKQIAVIGHHTFFIELA